MKEETFNRAKELMNEIDYNKQVIDTIEMMLENFGNSVGAIIDVTCKLGSGGITLRLSDYQLPELREALQKGLARFQQALKEKQEQMERL